MTFMTVDRRGRGTLPEEVRRGLGIGTEDTTLVILEKTERGTYELVPASLVPNDQLWFALLKQEVTPGLRVEPIQPEKSYLEARVNDGGRLVYRLDSGTLVVQDVVAHDDIDRYGRR